MTTRAASRELIGRRYERDLFDGALEAAESGRSTTLLVGGEAGVGKTRLVQAIVEAAEARGALVVEGACVPVHSGLAYGAVTAVLRDLQRRLGDALPGVAAHPLLSTQPATVGTADAVDARYSAVHHIADDLTRTALFESVLRLLATAAERSTTVVVFEDVHWADSGTADMIGFLVRNLTSERLLVLATHRTDDAELAERRRPWLQELTRLERVTSIALERLDKEETAQLVASVAGAAAPADLVDAVWNRSQGNPFFAGELLVSPTPDALPSQLRDLLGLRLDAAGDAARSVLRVVAVAGGRAHHDLVAAVAELGDGLDDALAESVERALLAVDSRRDGYEFRHRLLQEAAYDALLPGVRRKLHAKVARAIAAGVGSAGEPVDAALAYHWSEAGDAEAAFRYSLAAAATARSVWAFPEALEHLDRAIAALDRLPAEPPPLERSRLYEWAADAAYLTADRRAVDLARSAVTAAHEAHDADTEARCWTLVGRNAWAIGDSDAAFDAYRRAADLVADDVPTPTLARVLAEEARGLMLLSRFGEAEVHAERALAVAQAAGARAEEGHARYTLGVARASLGREEEGIALVREALAIAEDLGEADDLNRAYMGLSHLLVEGGRPEEGVALVFDAAAIGEEVWGVRMNGAASNAIEALIRLGRSDEARALLDLTGDEGVGSCLASPALLRSTLALRSGALDEARRILTLADGLSSHLADVQVRGLFHVRAAELAAADADLDTAYEHVEQALFLAAGTDDQVYRPEMHALGARLLADRFDQARATGERFDVDKARLLARQHVTELHAVVDEPVARGGTPARRAEAFASTCVAEASRLHGGDDEAWRDAGDRWDGLREPYGVAYCRWREAEVLLDAGRDRRRAVDCLTDSWSRAGAIGAHALRAGVEDLARRARVPLEERPRPEPSLESTVAHDLGLTPREVEVLKLLAAGRRDREIAEELFISKKTASVHVSNILRKLDAANRVEAGRIGQRSGLA